MVGQSLVVMVLFPPADLLGVGTRWIRCLAGRGEIDGHRGAGGCWNIDAASVEAYRRRRTAA